MLCHLSKFRFKLDFSKNIKTVIKTIRQRLDLKEFYLVWSNRNIKKIIKSVHPFNFFLFSKIGFYFGFFLGVIFSLYITKIIAILICDLKLEIIKFVLILLVTLLGIATIIFLCAGLGSSAGWLLGKYLNRRVITLLNFDKKSSRALKVIKLKHYHRRLKTRFQANKKIKPFKSTAYFHK